MEPSELFMRDLPEPRELSAVEAELIRKLARASGVPELVAQAQVARVVSECSCGCPSVGLTSEGQQVPVETVTARSSNGRDDYFGVCGSATKGRRRIDVVLHVMFGRVEELEIFAGEGRRVALPSARRLRSIWLL